MVYDLGVYCVLYEIGCGTWHSVTVLRIRSTVGECSISQLVFPQNELRNRAFCNYATDSWHSCRMPCSAIHISYSNEFIRHAQATS